MKGNKQQVRKISYNRAEFNEVLTATFKDLKSRNKDLGIFNWPVNPDAYTFFSYVDDRGIRFEITCKEDCN